MAVAKRLDRVKTSAEPADDEVAAVAEVGMVTVG